MIIRYVCVEVFFGIEGLSDNAYLSNIINTNTVIVRGGWLVGECNFQVLLSKLYYVQKAIWCCVYHECIHNGPNITSSLF